MHPKQPSHSARPAPDRTSYDEERTPFDQVLRKLVSTKPPHKAAKPVAPEAGKRPAKKPA